MELLIITGLSGSGKSRTASILEDMGYYIVDNLPAEMMVKFADFCAASQGHYKRVALVYDVRAGEPFDLLLGTLERLKSDGVNCRMLFLDTDTPTLIARYKETRRSHPLAEEGSSIQEAAELERKMLQGVREKADIVLDTTALSVGKLRSELIALFGSERDRRGIHVDVMSFGYKHGLPMEADLVFDVRFLPNPYYIPELKRKTGLDAPVRDYVFENEQTQEFLRKLEEMLLFLLPHYNEEGKTMLVVGIGCTGGHHRSVAITHEISARLQAAGFDISESHRDISR